MYLKQIEIVGFKSFADKSKIVLAPGVTGVVGPNGSGKSNIADAVRWVLGEQSVRNLRGSKMEDVIFAGSELRRPTNLCEVSMVLDNEDGHLPVVFDEVTITRRVFRSGESEYFINRQPCRLKDIHELFMDTGLGREAYSIIGQGKIEEMLSTRAEDRRGPFEDAAGIVKFKHRRKEAEKKLEETNANLLRVEDILAELEEQVGPLTREKERAEKYRELSDALEKSDITLLVVEIDKLNERFKQAVSSVEARQAGRDSAHLAAMEAEELWQRERRALDELTQQVEILQQNYVALVEKRQKRQGDLALVEQQLGYLDETKESRAAQYKQNVEEIENVQSQVETLRQALQNVEGTLHVKSGELEVAADGAKEQRKEQLAAELDELNADYIEANHRAATLRNEIKMLSEQVESEAGKRTKYEQEAEKWRTQIAEAENARNELLHSREQMEQALGAAADLISHCDSEYEQAMSAEAQTVSDLHRIHTDIQSLRSRLELLRDLEEGYDGYALGVRTVMQQANRGRLQGVHGSVAELIRVQKDVETAIETALGGALQNIVVNTEADARTAIQMLKQRQAGRATFMPIEVIQSRRMRDAELAKVENQQGFVGLASDLVDVDARFRVAVEHLLGNVVIADTLENANALARVLQYRVRIVTYQGDVVAPGGVMSGGHHQRKGPGLLGRSRERTDTEEKLKVLEQTEKQLHADQAKWRNAVTEAQEKRTAAQNRLEVMMKERQTVDERLRELEYTKSNAEERLAALEWEFNQLTSGTDVLGQRQAEAAAALAETERELVAISEATAAKREALATFEKQQQEMQDRVTSLRIEVATLRQERDTHGARLNELSSRRARLQQQIETWTQETAELEARRGRLHEQAENALQSVAELVDAVASSQADLDSARQARLEREAEVRRLEQEVAAKRKALAESEELLHRVQVASERADADLAHALQKMGDTHGMTYEWAKSRYPLTTSPEQLEQEVARLRRAVQALGDVNIGAIEEHARLSERISFLTQQQDDLVSAREKLDQLIHEIDVEMANRFMETFTQIQREFSKAFQILFNGGEASLQLTSPDDPLTTGIDVIAKPPGKRLQNLNLLSGGERALTAMALLFAILRVRPVPFCVLDEVEAALDEANVARFAQQLRVFAAETQFIVITHRRGTMEEADALYGVTMPERGVSALVSVRLADELDFETA
ncbi:chromosome segregation protein SMC [Alicyclobacillus dauci]|uniref:Chromosome partition protein Smc n=1 Tax=Alicyclobacillus dauci TaxID=1475485 RepID=A0ABY6YZS4_9BACL|nr:chromosome segregation protein SMC [Alicyclobacillus dauci]WAH35471.1 chromosome segregation protein SMC [Alicyclobacillus dauci]